MTPYVDDDARPRSDTSDIVELLRLWGGAFGEFGRLFGSEGGMHVTDSEALVQIISAEDRGTPLRQAELSRRIGLSTGATSSLITRLERAGHVERVRDTNDRRVVTMRSTAAVHTRAHDFFDGLGRDLEQSIACYPPELRRQFTAMMNDLNTVMMRHLAERRPR